VGYAVFRANELHWDEPTGGDQRRRIARLSDAMANMRANVWRLPPDTRGRRHVERVQEEVFAVLEGTATLMLGDPPERIDLACGSVAIVEPGTPLQVRNPSAEDTVVLIVGAPPVSGEADYLPDSD
jgi:mannose-6-phosphate isomerase-like protein (cupin superfamily)